MPAPGDQHSASSITTNPFEEPENRVQTYTAEQIATLQARLNKFLGPEYISTRDGPGGKKVHYIAAVQCIQLANEVFGFNGWSSSIRDVQVDYVEEIANTGKFNMAVSVIMRVTLRDGTYHEDIGYGQIENCRNKAVGFEKTKKEATTDALKRALRNFGNVLGNCIYDKDYAAKITKIKVKPPKFSLEDLHRHADYAIAPKQEHVATAALAAPSANDSAALGRTEAIAPNKIAVEDDFDTADFDDVDFSMAEEGHPDEIVVDEPIVSNHFATDNVNGNSRLIQRPDSHINGGSNQNQHGHNISKIAPMPPASVQAHSAAVNNGNPLRPLNPAMQGKPSFAAPQGPTKVNSPIRAQEVGHLHHTHQNPPRLAGSNLPKFVDISTDANNQTTTSSDTFINKAIEQSVQSDTPPVFLSARAAATPNSGKPGANDLFNPLAESPSIRKTAGIDHSKSMALKKTAVKDLIPAKANTSQPYLVNSNVENVRRIGLPPSAVSPIANRSSYKPPSKRPLDSVGGGHGPSRPPLNDLTQSTGNIGLNSVTPSDPKRQRIEGGIAAKPVGE